MNAISTDLKIENTCASDLEQIYGFFEAAMVFQSQNNFPVWKGYDRNTLQSEMNDKLQYKIIINNTAAIVFSVIYSDKFIWRERDKDDAIYLHRIVVNPEFRGQKLFRHIIDWAKVKARKMNRQFVRLDTWGDNPRMISYYSSFGFHFVENYSTGNSLELPLPHRNLFMALMELDVNG